MSLVVKDDLVHFLGSTDRGSVDAIITSPPFSGLPGRGDTRDLVEKILSGACDVLAENGTLTMIVGSGPDNLLTPYLVGNDVSLFSDLYLHSLFVWDRRGTLARDIGEQVISHDVILHIARKGTVHAPLAPQSIVTTSQPGYNYGHSVATPSDLAAFLVDAVSEPGDLIVDPMAGLGEIGMQAVHQGRRFAGCDLNAACVEIANARLNELAVIA